MTELLPLKDQILAAFTCQGSGNCCKTEGYVYITEQNAAQMASLLQLSITEFKAKFVQITDQGWMLIASPTHRKNCFLDSCNRCQVYEARPLACRTYPRWPEIWESEQSILAEVASCPGLKKAVQHSLESLIKHQKYHH